MGVIFGVLDVREEFTKKLVSYDFNEGALLTFGSNRSDDISQRRDYSTILSDHLANVASSDSDQINGSISLGLSFNANRIGLANHGLYEVINKIFSLHDYASVVVSTGVSVASSATGAATSSGADSIS
jgi:hypothetical protein